MTTLKFLDDIYQAAIKNWFEWEDKAFDESRFYEEYKRFAHASTDEIFDFITNDSSTFEWIVEQFSDAIDVVIKKHPQEVYSILQNQFGNGVFGKYFKEAGVKKEDIEKKTQNFLDALFSLILDKLVHRGQFWVFDAQSDYAEFLQKKINKFFGNKSLKGTRISAPQQMRRAAPQHKRATPKKRTPLPSKKNCPVKVNFRGMI